MSDGFRRALASIALSTTVAAGGALAQDEAAASPPAGAAQPSDAAALDDGPPATDDAPVPPTDDAQVEDAQADPPATAEEGQDDDGQAPSDAAETPTPDAAAPVDVEGNAGSAEEDAPPTAVVEDGPLAWTGTGLLAGGALATAGFGMSALWMHADLVNPDTSRDEKNTALAVGPWLLVGAGGAVLVAIAGGALLVLQPASAP